VKTKNWRALIRELRLRFPTESRVEVRRCPIREDGELTIGVDVFRIYVNVKLDKTGQVDALLHEWAHILTIEKAAYLHEGAWGVAYAAIYSMWEKWDEQK